MGVNDQYNCFHRPHSTTWNLNALINWIIVVFGSKKKKREDSFDFSAYYLGEGTIVGI